MKLKNTIYCLSSLAVLATLANTSVGCTVPIGYTEATPISTIKGGGLLGGLLPVTNFDLPIRNGSQKVPPGSKKIRLTAVDLRSVTADPSDRTEDALKDESLIEQCPAGRAHLDFIDEVTVKIKRSGEADSAAVLLAHYKKAAGANPCGFIMDLSDVNIKDYADDYSLITQVAGKAPASDVEIGGFITVTSDEGI